jgi:SUZ-C motif
MRWLARAAPRGPDGSIGFGVAERGPVPGPPVFALAFGPQVVPTDCTGLKRKSPDEGDQSGLSCLRRTALWAVDSNNSSPVLTLSH